MPRTHDFMTQCLGSFGLPLVESHQPRLFQFLHRSEVKPVQRTAIGCVWMPVLPQCGLENRRWQMTKMKRVEIPHRRQPLRP